MTTSKDDHITSKDDDITSKDDESKTNHIKGIYFCISRHNHIQKLSQDSLCHRILYIKWTYGNHYQFTNDIRSKDDDITVMHKRICMHIRNDVWKTKFKCAEKWQCCCAAVSADRCEAVC